MLYVVHYIILPNRVRLEIQQEARAVVLVVGPIPAPGPVGTGRCWMQGLGQLEPSLEFRALGEREPPAASFSVCGFNP